MLFHVGDLALKLLFNSATIPKHRASLCCMSARSVAASYKPPMLVTQVRLPVCALFIALALRLLALAAVCARKACVDTQKTLRGQFARVVKGVDLRSTGVNSAWVRTPQLTLTNCIPLIFVRLQASVKRKDVHKDVHKDVRRNMTPVGFEPTQLALVELESTPLDHSGKVSWSSKSHKFCPEHPPPVPLSCS